MNRVRNGYAAILTRLHKSWLGRRDARVPVWVLPVLALVALVRPH